MIETFVANEWDPLEEVVVGSALGARVPREDDGLRCVEYSSFSSDARPRSGPMDPRVIDESEEDLARLADALRALGVIVHRPAPLATDALVSTPDWSTDGMHAYCPRDAVLIVGETVIEAPMVLRARQHEVSALRPVLSACFDGGARWISAPRPLLRAGTYRAPDGFAIALDEGEPLFDAANVARLGDTLLYLVSDSANRRGARWLQSVVGPSVRVVALDRLRNTTHIDTTIVPVREGLVCVAAPYVRPDNLPEPLRAWDVLYVEDMVEPPSLATPIASKWIGLNLLMVRPDLAIVDRHQRPLIRALEGRGVSVLPLELRHARALNGGFHCVTLDLRRRAR